MASTAITRTTDTRLLRFALRADALITGGNGLAYLAGATLLDDLLGVPSPILLGVGVFLIGYAAAVFTISRPAHPSRVGTLTVVAINTVWALDSVVLVVAKPLDLTTPGAIWIVLQAAVVGAFVALQLAGLRRAG